MPPTAVCQALAQPLQMLSSSPIELLPARATCATPSVDCSHGQQCHRLCTVMRRPSFLTLALKHRLRSAPLSGAGGERDHAGHRQPMPVFHRGVAHVAELRLPPRRLAVKSAVGIGRACMRVVLALLPMEVGPAVIIAPAVLGAEALL